MARLVIDDDIVSGGTFPPSQLFVFGGFVLRANSIGTLRRSTATPLVTRSGLDA